MLSPVFRANFGCSLYRSIGLKLGGLELRGCDLTCALGFIIISRHNFSSQCNRSLKSFHSFFAGYHHPHCTEIDTLQAELEQMQSNTLNGQCGPSNGMIVGNSSLPNTGGTGTTRSNRSRRGSSRIGADSIDTLIDPSKEKTVNFANCVSPPSPHDPGFMGINNESYPCDCCQIDEAAFRRSYSTQMPCGPSGMMQFSEVSSFTHLVWIKDILGLAALSIWQGRFDLRIPGDLSYLSGMFLLQK